MRILLAALTFLCLVATAGAQDIAADGPAATPLQSLLKEHRAAIEQGARRGIGPAIEALRDSGLPEARLILEKWQARELWLRKADGLFFLAESAEGGYRLTDPATGEAAGSATRDEVIQIRPNSGIRAVLAGALVQFQLTDPNPAVRAAALDAIARRSEAGHLDALRAVLEDEPDPRLKARKARLERLLTISFDPDPDARIAAIEGFAGDIGVDVRAALNPLVATTRAVAPGEPPAGENIARRLSPGSEALPREAAYAMLVEAGLAPPRIGRAEIRAALAAHVEGGRVGGVPVAELNSDAARERAYAGLAAAGLVPAHLTEAGIDAALAAHAFYDRYAEADPRVTEAAADALAAIALMVGVNQMADLALDALSLASIYFLAAIGLAITFGVMRVINMAHGEFIMMGAYTGYVVQQFIPDYTISILVALPLAFAITFGAGVAMERLVIRWLYNRPLETLLATFGISIALQQLAKNIFGTQARPLTSPAWLDGSLVINDVVSISYIRIAIFVLALMFLGLFLFIMRRTRLGLEVRAVTQNPRMAASMGINPDRINMLTFGLGSGIAGVAGVAIGLYAKVTSELGQDYIVQSFMTVVVGGVGNIWGTLLGATLIGFLQKGIEWFNPSNTLAAQTYMILFIILFIQFRPRGIIALKGRAAGD
ncbi:urea ABC transporter permease subunit UrtB [Rhodovulum steppense]|uniref:Amino acid/amide ABC transporter membrane protein 1 (HAAT family) n=1 Tax=Rhodovulum steppense TaxID=540251 RepID=A0A4R1YXK8_9RHOB|nr:urea ABC transporter permease subunit UrtB [Rhodovulum steppense]TCM85736.1 amino acid/amide ABC transporter membrane protein 1 (HAAT family) [Rhodovulum steppense]